MNNDPFPVDKTADTVNTVINDAVKTAESIAETAVEAEIELNAPVFALPVLKQIEEEVVHVLIDKVGGEISVNLQHFGTFIVIDAQVSGEKKGISQALADLMVAEKSGGKNAIQAAIVEYQKAQSALVNNDGAAPAHP